MVIVDTREPDSTFKNMCSQIKTLRKLPADELVLERMLPSGDILISTVNRPLPTNVAQYFDLVNTFKLTALSTDEAVSNPQEAGIKSIAKSSILLERKTPSDFLSSLADGRLFSQAMNLVESTDFPIIAVMGNFTDSGDNIVVQGKTTGWDWRSVQMAILRIQLSGCTVIHLTEKNLPIFTCTLWKWLMEGNRPVRTRKPFPLIALSQDAEFLCSLPGIGPEKATDLLEYTGSVVDSMHFLTDETSAKLKNRPFGFGEKTIRTIRDFLKIRPGHVLMEVEAPQISGVPAQNEKERVQKIFDM